MARQAGWRYRFSMVLQAPYQGEVFDTEGRCVARVIYKRAPLTPGRVIGGLIGGALGAILAWSLAIWTQIAALIFLGLPVMVLAVWLVYRGWSPVPIILRAPEGDQEQYQLRQLQRVALWGATLHATDPQGVDCGKMKSSWNGALWTLQMPEGKRLTAEHQGRFLRSPTFALRVGEESLGSFEKKAGEYTMHWHKTPEGFSPNALMLLGVAIVLYGGFVLE